MLTDIEKLIEAAKSKRIRFLKVRGALKSSTIIGENYETPELDAKIMSFDTLIETLETTIKNA